MGEARQQAAQALQAFQASLAQPSAQVSPGLGGSECLQLAAPAASLALKTLGGTRPQCQRRLTRLLAQDAKRAEDLSRENTILKRAVAIQAQRLSEASASLAELPALKAQVRLRTLRLCGWPDRAVPFPAAEQREGSARCTLQAHTGPDSRAALLQVQEASQKVHSLELANYSLAMHLRQATSSMAGLHSGHPDVF